jgi:hypothetical protein
VVTWKAVIAVPLALAAAHVVSVRAVPATALPGSTISLRVTTAPASARVRVLLGQGERRVALRSVRRQGSRLTARVPASTVPGRYRVLVCPAGGRCKPARRRLTVLSAPHPAPHPLPTPPPGGSLSPHAFPPPGPIS